MTKGWAEKLLGDVITLQRGFDLPERERAVGTVPIVSSSGITGYHSASKVRAPGVVTGRYGTLGEVFYIDTDFWPLNTTLWVKDFKDNDPHYVSYLLRTLNLGLQNAAGAVPGVNRNALHMLPVRIPPRCAQEKIASVLSAYDDLIKNNTRRIKILEQMAQLLYREWFVNFRFPEHKKVKLAESEMGLIPDGWKVGKLADIAQIQWGDTSVTKSAYVNEDGYRAFSASGPDGKLNYFDFDRSGIVLSAIGANCGLTWYATGKWSCIKNTICFWADNGKATDEFLYFATRGKEFWPKRGSAQPFVSQGDARSIKLVIPPPELTHKFAEMTAPKMLLSETLRSKVENLRRTRDLLLPKLVSGEISVERLEAEVPVQTL